MQPKQYFMEKLESMFDFDQGLRLLDLGSGQSRNLAFLLEKYPNFHYVGIEPNKNEAETAQRLLKKYKHASVFNKLAYDKVDNQDDFDICLSLSVLEHVKQLERFLVNSINSVKKGGHIIHRYDLGHALYPCSVKEKFQIFLGNNFPKVLPEKKFVRYLDENEVCRMLEDNGAKVNKITYHQMPNHKAFLKHFATDTSEKLNLAKEILEWEFRVSKYLRDIEQKKRELLFPSICIWAVKK